MPRTATPLRGFPAGPQYTAHNARSIDWEHGRRNMGLYGSGILPIVCPVRDDSPLCGVGIFAVDVLTANRLPADDPGARAGVFTYAPPVTGFAVSRA